LTPSGRQSRIATLVSSWKSSPLLLGKSGGREIVKKLEEWCPTSGLGRTAFYLAPKAKCID
jgi:hypothetical protein